MHQSVRKNVMRVLLVVGLVIGVGFGMDVSADEGNHINYFSGNIYSFHYTIRTKSKYNYGESPKKLNKGDLELVFKDQISPNMLNFFNQKNTDGKYPEFPSIYFNIWIGGPYLGFVDTIRFEKSGYSWQSDYFREKLKMPKNIGSFLYKNPDFQYIEGLNNIDISETEGFEWLFGSSEYKNIDISTWNLRGKTTGDLGIHMTSHDSITLGSNTVFSGGRFDDDYQPKGKMINQETGFSYNAKTFFHDYDGTQPGTYKYTSD